jgi:hypothetical protein
VLHAKHGLALSFGEALFTPSRAGLREERVSWSCTLNTASRSHSAPQHSRVGLHHRTRVPRNEWMRVDMNLNAG